MGKVSRRLTKVYLLINDLGYEGDIHKGVFASKEGAEAAKAMEKDHPEFDESWVIEEWEINYGQGK